MTEDRGQPEDFGDLSDEEIQTFSQEIVESIPEMMSEVLGKDLEADFDPEDQVVNEIEQIFMQFRDAAQAESEEERSEKMMHILDESAAQAFSQMDFIEGSEKEGLEALIEYHEESFEDGYDLIESWGYEEYLEKVDGLAVELIEDGKDQKVTALYEDEVDRNTGMMQRLIDPLFEEYLPLLEDSDIKDADEVRKYQDMYEETAELYAGLLPEFITVLQIKKVGNHEYEELKNYSLNNLLQKLNSKKFPQYNIFAGCLNRKIRNAIAHRDSKINPTEESIEFYDRGDFVDELSYEEFGEESIELFSAFYALWCFNSRITYHKIKTLPEMLEDVG